MPVQQLHTVYNRMILAITDGIFATRDTNAGFIDNGLGVVSTGSSHFGGKPRLLLDVLVGVFGMRIVFGDTAQTSVERLPGFIIYAGITFDKFGIGAAITLYYFVRG